MDDDIRNRFRRDYTKEVIRPPKHREKLPEPALHQPTPQQDRSPRRLWLILGLLILIVAAATGGYIYRSKRLVSPIPLATRASVNFPLLYPTKLPTGYQLNPNSYSSAGGVVVYYATDPAGDKLPFSVQKRPTTTVLNSLDGSLLKNPSVFNTPIGKASIGTVNGKLLGSLVTSQTWLLTSPPSNSLQLSDLKLILENVKVSPR